MLILKEKTKQNWFPTFKLPTRTSFKTDPLNFCFKISAIGSSSVVYTRACFIVVC